MILNNDLIEAIARCSDVLIYFQVYCDCFVLTSYNKTIYKDTIHYF